ncbi:hypothetical protein ACEPPN_011240 [Leptodophora sp. 'Broadleaf-Isolate-01']
MAGWQAPGRKNQFVTNWAILLLIFFLVMYCVSWNDLQYSLPSFKSTSTTVLPSSPYDLRKLAFLVETRPLPHLPALFTHMMTIIPPEWTFKFMGSPVALAFMRASPTIARFEASGKLQFLDIPSNYSLSNRETISQMFTDPHLYRDILAPAEHLLVWQPDSIFCANAPTTLNDFLQWDWIGAPWSKTAEYGGNGGLSLRKVSRIMDVLGNKTRKNGDGALEDLWMVQRLHELDGNVMPGANISKTFSVESVWDDRPLGYHIGWLGVHHEQIWDDQSQVDHIMEYCPEVKMILGMKLDNDKPAGIPR